MFFFFKQKTAYEMRISDWSSDVCSSDLHPVDMVYAGPIFWDSGHAQKIMRWYREFLPSAPEELCCFLGLKTAPSTAPFPREIWGQRICALISCYNGAEEDGVAAIRSVRDALPPPLLDAMAMMPFPTLQGLFDPLQIGRSSLRERVCQSV